VNQTGEGSSTLERAHPPEDLLDTAMGMLSQPVDTLRRVTSNPPVAWALIVAGTISLGSALAGAGDAGGFGRLPNGFEPARDGGGTLVVATAIGAVVVSIALLFVWSGIVHGTSRLLGGRGPFSGTLSGFGFATVPSVLGIPAQLLPLLLGTSGAILSGLVQLGITIWVIVLEVIAARENHRFSTGRAVAALLIPIAVLLALLVIAVIALVAVVAGSVGGS
jgi:hypothetical protein